MTESAKLPDVPDADTWNAMTPDERMDVVRAFRAALGVGRLQNVFPDPAPGYATTPAWILNDAPQVEPTKAGKAKPFIQYALAPLNRAVGTCAGATHGITPLATAETAGGAFVVPDESRWLAIQATSGCFQPYHHLDRALRMLAGLIPAK